MATGRFDSTSWSLVLGAAGNEPEDAERFCRRYEPLVRRYLGVRWRLPDHHERVADATQEVFLRCFQPDGPLHRLDPRKGKFRWYLRAVTGNVASEYERRRRRESKHANEQELEDIVTSEASLSEAYDRAWAELVTREAWELMARRKSEHRYGGLHHEVLILRFVDGLQPGEIAERLGFVDVKEVYRIVKKGRQQFRTAIVTALAAYYPDLTARELEEKRDELLELLR